MLNDQKNITVVITSGTIVRTILLLLLCAFVYFFLDLVLVILTAVVIASAVEPATRWFGKHRVSRLPAVMIIYIGFILSLAGLFYIFIPPIIEDAIGFLTTLPGHIDLNILLGPISEKIPIILQPGLSALSENLSLLDIANNLKNIIGGTGGLFKVISAIFGGIASLVLVVVLSFYLSVQEDGVANFLRIVTPLRHEKYVIGLWKRSQYKIGRWMQGQVILGLIIGLLVYLGLSILGVRYALLLAILAALFEIIPVFGPILASVPALLIGLIDGGLTMFLLIGGLYIITQQFENHLIYPLVVRKVVGIPPLLVILALVIGARLAGFLGIVLSVPLAAALREYIADIEAHKIEEEKVLFGK